MELDVHDDMYSLFTFEIEDFVPPPQLSPSPDRLPTIEEDNLPKHTSTKQHNQQHQQLDQQPQHNQQLKYSQTQLTQDP